ncbi:predicted protein [Naegleria gruberi]|uniref:Predicted protein n=1 Tax=Naegleria gruberi TaxID=5762 RepID=D2V4B4_NAEGR|nr:uncharacterized protein NAEGRDRAFT_63664 [Naegleria gruberi]EFC48355.1 predicted protein [Naegleria gruberi]|eukprot:XP_002681099.1 predicted protein [Naegleria gruberi strain NEG-M]
MCFTEYFSENTHVSIALTVPQGDFAKPSDLYAVRGIVKDSYGLQVASVNMFKPIGTQHIKFITSTFPRDFHSICFYWDHPSQETNVDIKVEDEFRVAQGQEKKDIVEVLSAVLQEIGKRLDSITDQQAYFKEREERFRYTSESTLERTFFFGLGKFIAIVGATAYQIIALRLFFKKAKVI